MKNRLLLQFLLAIVFFVVPGLALGQTTSDGDFTVRHPSSSIPVVGFLQDFFFTGRYRAHLNVMELRIDHMADQTQCSMPHRACRLSLGYSTPIGRNLGMSQFELPLVGATGITSHWSQASVGDYVARFWGAPAYIPVPSSAVKLILTLAF